MHKRHDPRILSSLSPNTNSTHRSSLSAHNSLHFSGHSVKQTSCKTPFYPPFLLFHFLSSHTRTEQVRPKLPCQAMLLLLLYTWIWFWMRGTHPPAMRQLQLPWHQPSNDRSLITRIYCPSSVSPGSLGDCKLLLSL